jgi:hypothetical protein
MLSIELRGQEGVEKEEEWKEREGERAQSVPFTRPLLLREEVEVKTTKT